MSTLKSVTIVHPSSAVNNIVNDASGNVAVGNNLTVAGTSSFTGTLGNITTGTISSGNITSSGTVAATTGTLYPIVSGTAVASTSGTNIDFTGIPSWVKRVTVMFNSVSTNGSSLVQIQLGSGSVQTTGYKSTASFGAGTASQYAAATTGFITDTTTVTSTTTRSGFYVFCLLGSNVWTGSGTIGGEQAAFITYACAGNSPALSGTLDRVRITTVNGTDTFDAGTINIMYE
jgi:hypothetical protein